MFHEKCLKESLQTSIVAKPKCPVCHVLIESALVAIPTEENPNSFSSSYNNAAWNSASLNQGQAVSDAKV